MDLNALDAARGGPFRVLADGEVIVLPAASALHWQTVVAVTTSPHYFVTMLWPITARIEAWKIDKLHEAWISHQGLPPAEQMRRLVYMMERYGEGIQYDLRRHLGMSAAELWRDRAWTELLLYIDRLPADSHMNQQLANDEEHMTEAMKHAGPTTAGRPSLSDWSMTNSLLATLIDAVNRNTATTQAVAGVKGNHGFDPYPRPQTVADKVRYRMEKTRHEEMNSLLLPKQSTAS